jgi:AcrR family transcriptional regulator
MAAVAQRAGVSTKTIYRLIPNKADLLTRVVSDRIGQFVLEIDPDGLDSLPLPEALG